MYEKSPILFVNFGGPRTLDEIEPFLIALLTDPDVIRTKMPYFFQKYLFTRVAKKRALKIAHDYAKIGGKSPIYDDTEMLAQEVRTLTGRLTFTFHRYLPATHKDSIKKIAQHNGEILVFPLFPQFSFATTGSIARFLGKVPCKLRWIKSYAAHPAYLQAMHTCLRVFLEQHRLQEEEVALLFSAHGLPQEFVDTGDIYEQECKKSFHALSQCFPRAIAQLAYQSKFGPEEWLKPYTDEMCINPAWCKERKTVVIVPLSFTSDHIETLFEIEALYLPLLREKGFLALRCPALNLRKDWVQAICQILQEKHLFQTSRLIRT